MALVLYNNKILMVGGKLAKSTDCCCAGKCCDCDRIGGKSLNFTMSGPVTVTGTLQAPGAGSCINHSCWEIGVCIFQTDECGVGYVIVNRVELGCTGGTENKDINDIHFWLDAGGSGECEVVAWSDPQPPQLPWVIAGPVTIQCSPKFDATYEFKVQNAPSASCPCNGQIISVHVWEP